MTTPRHHKQSLAWHLEKSPTTRSPFLGMKPFFKIRTRLILVSPWTVSNVIKTSSFETFAVKKTSVLFDAFKYILRPKSEQIWNTVSMFDELCFPQTFKFLTSLKTRRFVSSMNLLQVFNYPQLAIAAPSILLHSHKLRHKLRMSISCDVPNQIWATVYVRTVVRWQGKNRQL